jgi:23S rRNA pseudouridine2605 synthase
MFDSVGHSVVKLRRVRIGEITDRGLAVGGHRDLTEAEVKRFYTRSNPPTSSKRKNQKKRET